MKTRSDSVRLRAAAGSGLSRGGGLTSADQPSPLRRLWLLLLPAALIAALLWWQGVERSEPLASYALAGDRAPACLRTVVLRDQSGSMAQYATAREQAMQQLVDWGTAGGTLRATDELAIIDFGEDAAVTMATRVIGNVAAAIPPSATIDTGGTSLAAALLAMEQLPPTTCQTSIIALSDGQTSTVPAAALQSLATQGVTSAALVLPGPMAVPEAFSDALPYAITVEAPADDPNRTARAVAEAMAASVNQRLERR